MLLKPNDQIFLNKKITVKDYNKYYLSNLSDEKIKFCFFIKNFIQKDKIIKNLTIPKDIFSYVKKNFLNKKK